MNPRDFYQDVRVYFGHKPENSMGGPRVKMLRMGEYFTNHEEDFNLVYCLYGSMDFADVYTAKVTGIPVVQHLNSFYHRAYRENFEEMNRGIRQFYDLADGIVFGSEFARQAAERFFGRNSAASTIIYNAVDTRHFSPGESRPDHPVILCIGNHYIRHRIEPLLHAMPLVQKKWGDAGLVIAGRMSPGPGIFNCDGAEMRALAQKLKIRNIEFVDSYTQGEAPEIYNRCNVMVHLKHMDWTPNTVVEGMACGMTIVHTGNGGVPELLEDCGVSLNLPADWDRIRIPDPEALAEAIGQAFLQRIELGKKARALAVQKFDMRDWALKHSEFFREMVKTRSRPDYRGEIRQKVLSYLGERKTGNPGEYTMCAGGQETLYASCFAAMTHFYLNGLEGISGAEKEAWALYLRSWQREDGFFYGPEIPEEVFSGSVHDRTHVLWHLACHVLPALNLLGGKPVFRLKFADPFLNPGVLSDWLQKIDWKEAWKEGNNLIFMLQILTYLYEKEGISRARDRVMDIFDWLDREQDPETGLWGTNGYCDAFKAMCGGYHQLVAYVYWKRKIPHRERILDTVLSLQKAHGGFNGTCEDIDAGFILAALGKETDYRRTDIEKALRRLERRNYYYFYRGGFVYNYGMKFCHMGLPKTAVPEIRTPELFSTWFRIHLALVIEDYFNEDSVKRFNDLCSMGWYKH